MKFLLKYLDKFLKIIKTDRNTFFAYILALVSAYLVIDRMVELIIMWFTGMSVSYWNPFEYTLAFICIAFAFSFTFSSKFTNNNTDARVTYFYTYCIALYIVAVTMFVQWINYFSWIFILSVPNYKEIIMNFSDLIRPAFTALSLYLPIVTFYPILRFLYVRINDPIFPNAFKDSIMDYMGIDINPPSCATGLYSFELNLCQDKKTGKPAKILEDRRFQNMLIQGPTGCGKTSMMMHPFIAQDLEKKYFFNEAGKEMAYIALKTGIAYLEHPYDNEYLDKNFSLSMLTPIEGKEALYKAYMHKIIYSTGSDGQVLYRNLGLTYIAPEPDDVEKAANIAKAYNIPVTIVDPADPNSPGINPFAMAHAPLCALIISDVLKSLYDNQSSKDTDEAYMENSAHQALQNLVILLKYIYPKLHDGDLPNLDDVLQCCTDFDYVEELCEEARKDKDFMDENFLTISYFEQNFYKNAEGRASMKRLVHFAAAQLDYLFKSAECRRVLCQRRNNIDYREYIARGEVVLLCSRYADFGGLVNRAIGRFFLFSLLRGMEDTFTLEQRLPHFVYIDGFDFYAWPPLVDLFTMNRKLKVGATIAVQTIHGIEGSGTASKFMQKISGNTMTKLSFGNCTVEDYEWWEKEFANRREWVVDNKYDSATEAYSTDVGNARWDYKLNLTVAKIQGLASKECVYKTKDKYGKNKVGYGLVDFVASKHLAAHKSKSFDFNKYNIRAVVEEEKMENKNFNPDRVKFEDDDTGPIKTDTTDSKYFFDNAEAISFNFGKKNNE
ncbi:MAG: hypothetical protein FWC53_01660 [Firmicutes bacterium]|nr:hypothetical protein [Bacillota bacterium]